MRVIAGEARSLPLKTPQGLDTRPTTDRIKKLCLICSSLICPAAYLSICAAAAAASESKRSAGVQGMPILWKTAGPAKCIAENLHFTKFEDRATLLKQDVVSALSSIHEKEADVIFMDPPYQSGLEEPVLAALSRMPYVTDETLIVIEATLDRDFSFAEEYGFSIKKEKCYKTNKHVFLAKEEKNESSNLSGQL